jgi:MFS family permease
MHRILIGLSAGLVMVAVPPYLASLSKKYKTVLGTLHQISIGLGMIIAQSLSLVLSRPMLWRIEMAIGTGIAMVLLVTGLTIGEPKEQREEDEEVTPLLREQSTQKVMGTREVFTSNVRYGSESTI